MYLVSSLKCCAACRCRYQEENVAQFAYEFQAKAGGGGIDPQMEVAVDIGTTPRTVTRPPLHGDLTCQRLKFVCMLNRASP